MARPKKLSDNDAIRLVDSLYERCGDPAMLRFSELEKQAATLGFTDVKAYDLRRNPTILQRISEIETFALDSEPLATLAYKSLDIDAFIQSNRTSERLRRSLSEIDERLRKLYECAVSLSEQRDSLAVKLRSIEAELNELKAENAALSDQNKDNADEVKDLRDENRYLRRKIKNYLYPALADEVLRGLGESNLAVNNAATDAAVRKLADIDTPASISESIATDIEIRSREDDLMARLRNIANGGGQNAR